MPWFGLTVFGILMFIFFGSVIFYGLRYPKRLAENKGFLRLSWVDKGILDACGYMKDRDFYCSDIEDFVKFITAILFLNLIFSLLVNTEESRYFLLISLIYFPIYMILFINNLILRCKIFIYIDHIKYNSNFSKIQKINFSDIRLIEIKYIRHFSYKNHSGTVFDISISKAWLMTQF